jgi:hypothetical protein
MTENTFHKDLVSAFSSMPHITYDAQNSHFKASYLSLSGLLNAVRPVLGKYNLGITQDVRTDSNAKEVVIVTTLVHTSGQKAESSQLRIPVAQFTAQQLGSSITYGRRYSLLSMLGVAGEDDDGEAATPKVKTVATKKDIANEAIPF